MSLHPNWHIVIGSTVTVIFGFGVDRLIRCVGRSMGPLPAPSVEVAQEWEELTRQNTGGFWIGHIERPIFFAALWIPGAWVILSSWLVFKLAFYWQNTNFSAFPEDPPSEKAVRYLIAKRQLGLHQVATALVGTGANIVLALVGVAVGRWVVLS